MKRRPPLDWTVSASPDEISIHFSVRPRDFAKRWPEGRRRLIEMIRVIDERHDARQPRLKFRRRIRRTRRS